ncbi:hypothetical protein HDU97_001859, partial [Phlyctochytrium planicorne]
MSVRPHLPPLSLTGIILGDDEPFVLTVDPMSSILHLLMQVASIAGCEPVHLVFSRIEDCFLMAGDSRIQPMQQSSTPGKRSVDPELLRQLMDVSTTVKLSSTATDEDSARVAEWFPGSFFGREDRTPGPSGLPWQDRFRGCRVHFFAIVNDQVDIASSILPPAYEEYLPREEQEKQDRWQRRRSVLPVGFQISNSFEQAPAMPSIPQQFLQRQETYMSDTSSQGTLVDRMAGLNMNSPLGSSLAPLGANPGYARSIPSPAPPSPGMQHLNPKFGNAKSLGRPLPDERSGTSMSMNSNFTVAESHPAPSYTETPSESTIVLPPRSSSTTANSVPASPNVGVLQYATTASPNIGVVQYHAPPSPSVGVVHYSQSSEDYGSTTGSPAMGAGGRSRSVTRLQGSGSPPSPSLSPPMPIAGTSPNYGSNGSPSMPIHSGQPHHGQHDSGNRVPPLNLNYNQNQPNSNDMYQQQTYSPSVGGVNPGMNSINGSYPRVSSDYAPMSAPTTPTTTTRSILKSVKPESYPTPPSPGGFPPNSPSMSASAPVTAPNAPQQERGRTAFFQTRRGRDASAKRSGGERERQRSVPRSKSVDRFTYNKQQEVKPLEMASVPYPQEIAPAHGFLTSAQQHPQQQQQQQQQRQQVQAQAQQQLTQQQQPMQQHFHQSMPAQPPMMQQSMSQPATLQYQNQQQFQQQPPPQQQSQPTFQPRVPPPPPQMQQPPQQQQQQQPPQIPLRQLQDGPVYPQWMHPNDRPAAYHARQASAPNPRSTAYAPKSPSFPQPTPSYASPSPSYPSSSPLPYTQPQPQPQQLQQLQQPQPYPVIPPRSYDKDGNHHPSFPQSNTVPQTQPRQGSLSARSASPGLPYLPPPRDEAPPPVPAVQHY